MPDGRLCFNARAEFCRGGPDGSGRQLDTTSPSIVVLPGAVMFGALNKELNLTAKLVGAVSIKVINRCYVTDLSKRGVLSGRCEAAALRGRAS
jgi:hypothetical protein